MIEIEALKERIEENLGSVRSLGAHYGGTKSSYGMAEARRIQEYLNSGALKGEPWVPEYLEKVNRAIDLWRICLQRHNAQSMTVYQYDVETGVPMDSDENNRRSHKWVFYTAEDFFTLEKPYS